MIDRRIEEASALRQFFQEQWGVLQRLMGGDPELQVECKVRETRLTERVESIVDGTDVRMRGVSRYQKRLRQSDIIAVTMTVSFPVGDGKWKIVNQPGSNS